MTKIGLFCRKLFVSLVKTVVFVTYNELLKTTFPPKTPFLFFVLSVLEIEQKFLAFPRKIWPACQNCLFWFYVPRWTFFEKKEIFRKKSVFYQFGTWGKNKWSCVIFFAAVVSKLHFNCPYNHFDDFFSKNLQLFQLSDTWKNKLQLFFMKSLAGFSNFQFHVSTGTFGGKKVEKFEFFYQCRRVSHIFWPFDKTFPAG